MKFYTHPVAPNPRIVEMVLLEKGIEAERQNLDLKGGESREPDFLAKNPLGQVPALEIEDGSVICEVPAIVEYLEELRPDPVLIGHDASARAEARMWARRIDMAILWPMQISFQHGVFREVFEKRMKIYPELGDAMMQKAADGLVWLDEMLAGKSYLCGERVTYGDFMLYAYIAYFSGAGQKIDPRLANLAALLDLMRERDSIQKTTPPSA